ncbi:site-specific DNA recombinase [[Clostridium] sordellii]|nr:site-specific DNA recombinase [[Clostridium] sordellii] [Paeniclostridium sordellii]
MKDLLQDANAGKFNLVIVWKLNRISRKLIDILNIVDTLDKNKIAFRSLTESFETEIPAGKLQLNIMGAIGEFERGTIAENVKMGMIARAREGKWNGGKVIGYYIVEIPSEGKKRKETKLIINEKEAMTVSRPTRKRKDVTKAVNEYYVCGNWKNKGAAVCNSNSVKAEVADEVVIIK